MPKEETSILHPNIRPRVITKKFLEECILKQAMDSPHGGLLTEDQIDLESVSVLRLDFMKIMLIDCLWMLKSLTRLTLTHNRIEELEHLDELVNLKELDVSFNRINKIINLDKLVCLEILKLNDNQIEVIENLNENTKLVIVSVSRNHISDRKHIIYLRQFKNLRSFSIKGNPCCEQEECFAFIKAVLPQIVYLDYKLIKSEEKSQSELQFKSILNVLNEEDAHKEAMKQIDEVHKKIFDCHQKAFVECISGEEIFNNMFEDDRDGKILLNAKGILRKKLKSYKFNFTLLQKQMVEYGLGQHRIREKEIESFEKAITESRDESMQKCRKIMETYNNSKTDESKSVEHEIFNNTIDDLWKRLMTEEITLYEQCEETRNTFFKNLNYLIMTTVDGMNNFIKEWLKLENNWIEETKISDLINKQISTNDTSSETQYDNVLNDPETLTDIIKLSKENHILFINGIGEDFTFRLNNWMESFVKTCRSEEIKRYRNSVLELNNFIKKERMIISTSTTG